MTPVRPKRLVVTGGRGRLAALIADHFRAPAHDVSLYSRGGGAGFRHLDELAQPAALAQADTLLHLAWSTLPATSEQNPGSELKNDLPLLEKLLQACVALPAKQRPHFIFFSSGGAVYGNAPGRPSVETDPCRPIGHYGRAKLAAEQLIEQAVARHDLPCAILRISNPYGFSVPTGRVQGIIPHAVRSALEGRTLTLWGDGHARKDFIHYTDFLSALAEVVTRRLTGVYNLSVGESHSVHEVIALVEKHTGRKIPLAFQPAPPWDVEDSRLDNARLVAATGWRPKINLEQGIQRSLTADPRPVT
jgi:UDP-glucose 4-epimerase